MSRRPRVLFVTTSYPSDQAPATGIFVKEHAVAASAHADVAVVHLDRRPGARPLYRRRRDPGEPFPTWRVWYPHSPLPLSIGAHVAATVSGVRAAWRAGFAPDLLHAHFFLAGASAVLVGRLVRRPVVVTEQWSVFLPSDPMELSPFMRRAARFAFEGAEFVLPPSEALRRAIEDHGIHARFRIIPNVVDTDLFGPGRRANGRTPNLLAVGLLYEAKGYEYLLEAAGLLTRAGRDFQLDVVGDGPLRTELERQARELGVADRVRFHGLVPKPEVARFMREADAFVLTSRYDNNPCAVVEALASGLPVVATAVGGLPELVDEGSGLLAEPGNSQEIAQRLAVLLDRLDSYDRTSIARAAAARFGRERVGRLLADVYSEALERRGKALLA